MKKRWDIFCKVIDNYGDIGVTWRLARQLAAEHGIAARLWVDELESLERLCATVDSTQDAQVVAGVEVRRWDGSADSAQPADIVIEAFACELPESYQTSMAMKKAAPVWINLEYLSAEDWVAGCHALPSKHPHLPLTKTFFFPGFTRDTGGLLRERDLLDTRDAFQGNAAARRAFWARLGVPKRQRNEWRVSLFCYANAPVPELLKGLSAHPHPVRLIVTQGPAAIQVADWFGCSSAPGTQAELGNLGASFIPFVEQTDYDRVLWGCDLNFVRGEDSFVRGQWAGRPVAWHIYPQSERAHEPKLAEFTRRYVYGLHEPRRLAVERFMRIWNGLALEGRDDAPAETDIAAQPPAQFTEIWRAFAANQSTLRLHAEEWAWKLAEQPDLTAQLVEFVEKRPRSGV